MRSLYFYTNSACVADPPIQVNTCEQKNQSKRASDEVWLYHFDVTVKSLAWLLLYREYISCIETETHNND